jgi:hypothetical protein
MPASTDDNSAPAGLPLMRRRSHFRRGLGQVTTTGIAAVERMKDGRGSFWTVAGRTWIGASRTGQRGMWLVAGPPAPRIDRGTAWGITRAGETGKRRGRPSALSWRDRSGLYAPPLDVLVAPDDVDVAMAADDAELYRTSTLAEDLAAFGGLVAGAVGLLVAAYGRRPGALDGRGGRHRA